MKKNLYKKVLNKWLANAILGVNNILSFKIYRAYLIIINDCIIWLNNNYKEFSFEIILKSEYVESAVESAEEDVMKWEMIVAALKLEKQKTYIKSN